MNRKTLLATALLVVHLAFAAVAQPPGEGPLPRQSLAAQRPWVKFGVVLGRIQVLNSQVGQSLNATSEDPDAGVRESFSVNAGSDDASVHYELTTPDVQVTIDFRGPDRLEIERTPRTQQGGTRLHLVQPQRGPVTLVVGREGEVRRFEAQSFWHLMLQHRELCESHLLPLLTRLRPAWQLGGTANEVEANLLRLARRGCVPETNRWSRLVQQLGDGTFQQRRAAERQLRGSGQAVVSYLTQLDPRELDTEQRERIRSIVRGLVSHTEDTPQRVALWLAADQTVWLAMMARDDPETRRIAGLHLATLTGRPVEMNVERRQQNRTATKVNPTAPVSRH
jgi:hypothetical protein